MKTTLHLVSMPFERTNVPSIQLGCLKAYLDGVLGDRVPTFTHSAFVGVLVRPTAERERLRRNPMFDTVATLESATLRKVDGVVRALPRYLVGELPYMLLYHRRFGSEATRRALAAGAAAHVRPTDDASRWIVEDCTSEENLAILEAATIEYLERSLVPRLAPDAVNVVGFSCTFNQTYASAYALRWLQARCPDRPLLFLFGGSSVGMPTTASTLRRLELDALCVIGEGELKLRRLLEGCLDFDGPLAGLPRRLLDPDAGVVHARDEYDCRARNPAYSSRQLETLDVLPCPDYDEYFAELRHQAVDEAERAASSAQVELPLEGSRGCAFACTFCNLNHLWDGYRLQDAEIILAHTLELQRRYGTPTSRIRFVDNLCNWASGFADAAIGRGIEVPCFLELRARYPEAFWRKLRALGVWGVQVGIESLSTSLLEVMDKKSRAVDNVRAMKFLDEQGIAHRSNFIIDYPGSTLGHVQETRRVLEHLVHLRPLDSTVYELVEGSPLYYGLAGEVQGALTTDRGIAYSDVLAPLVTDFAFAVPDALAPPHDVRAAWHALADWYRAAAAARPRFEIARVADGVRIVDERWGAPRELQLTGDRARVLDVCHRGLKLAEVAQKTRLPLAQARALVEELVAARLLLEVDEVVINVALRPPVEVQGSVAPEAPPAGSEVERRRLPVIAT